MKRFLVGILTGIMLLSSFSVSAATLNIAGIIPYEINDLSVAENVEKLQEIIDDVNKRKSNGTLTNDDLKEMGAQLLTLEDNISKHNEPVTSEVVSVIKEVENAVADLTGYSSAVEKVLKAVSKVKESLEIDDEYDVSNDTFVYHPKDIGNLKGFSDLGNHEWARAAIEDMSIGSYKGLFSGKTPPDEQGLAMFDPNGRMSEAEFITVVTRALYSDELAGMPADTGEIWYLNHYIVALDKGLMIPQDIYTALLYAEENISRQEVAAILIRACKQMGESFREILIEGRVHDYDSISSAFRTDVLTAYEKGLLTGKDELGNFFPHDTLTRAEGATILYRLVNPSKRIEVLPFDSSKAEGEVPNEPLTIHEWEYGQTRGIRNAKEGDIFIKKDGTQIVLKKDQYGILGGGQGVAPDVGLNVYHEHGNCVIGPNGGMAGGRFMYDEEIYGILVDSTGTNLKGQGYFINATTGEGHWEAEYDRLMEHIPAPDRDGAYQGELSPDSYHLYVWQGSSWSYNRLYQ
ncbi:MAG: hypothetical protein E7409_01425 [Ruminococcaceae bacterium]|nr:hypothetical protein [Oscillospiraceae bacterium]